MIFTDIHIQSSSKLIILRKLSDFLNQILNVRYSEPFISYSVATYQAKLEC